MAASTAATKGRTATPEKARRDAMSEILADSWWAVGLRGLLSTLSA